jgi:hypothetical protein
MRLTKTGIVEEYDIGEHVGVEPMRPDAAGALLSMWHSQLDGLDADYTFGDLIALLRRIDDIAAVAPLLRCDVRAFLEDAESPRGSEHRDPMQYLQVCNAADPQQYCPDPSEPDASLEWLNEDGAAEQDRVDAQIAELTGSKAPRKVIDATEDDPITGEPMMRRLRIPERHGRWTAPFRIARVFEGWGKQQEPYPGYFGEHPEIDPSSFEGPFALEFTPVSELLELPLKYNPTVRFWSGYANGLGELLLDTQITITFGEFLSAIFEEIGFFGTPEERADALATIRERADGVRRASDAQGNV